MTNKMIIVVSCSDCPYSKYWNDADRYFCEIEEPREVTESAKKEDIDKDCVLDTVM